MHRDVVICGGGLAGLTLALQLRSAHPERSIIVAEPTRRPLAIACHKVGESTVEIGGHYFGEILGLGPYLRREHLIKNGLRFFSGAPSHSLSARCEMGPQESPSVPSYQLDRGALETALRERCAAATIELREGVGVRSVAIGDPHVVELVETRGGGAPERVEARWVVDATGRRRLLAKSLGLHVPIEEQAGSTWFRVDERIRIDQLVPAERSSWHSRDIDGNRWLSTNHLCGEGYWVWIIPLASGHTSIGIVAEAAVHPFQTFGSRGATLRWIKEYEPALAERIEGVPWADFTAMKNYRHSASRVFSAQRWACVGEAGIFVDPLYSPGSDLIGLANTLAAQLIGDDLRGELDPARADSADRFYQDWAGLLARTMIGGSKVFGAPEVFAAKLHWDFFYYWAFMCPYFFRRCWALRPAEHERFESMLGRYTELNERAQQILQAWAPLAPRESSRSSVGLPAVATTLSDLHAALHEELGVDETYAAMLRSLEWGEDIVMELLLRGLRRAGAGGAAAFLRAASPEGVDAARWAPSELRLDADEAGPRARRKLLSKAARDMERSVGKSQRADGPSLRELWAKATEARR